MANGSDHPEINRMLGSEGSLGEMLGLDAEWAVRAIAAEGNYAEIFEKYLGAGSPLGLPRVSAPSIATAASSIHHRSADDGGGPS